jgi:hypothetical protein
MKGLLLRMNQSYTTQIFPDEKRGQGSIRTVLLDSGLLRASARAKAAFQAQISDHVIAPVVVAKGAAAVDGVAQCCEFFEVVRLV